ncbi:MAG: HIT family protein [Mailhella sp.]|nr:HIT family protein [Mailhella sp.]
MPEENCIFCRIANGEIPSAKVYEDENVMAFLDLAPVHAGHTLIVPKKHIKDALAFPAELASAVAAAVQKVARALVAATGAQGFNVLQNNGLAAGQTVFHIHWHIIPRFEGDGLEMWRQGSYLDASAMQEMAKKISLAVQK